MAWQVEKERGAAEQRHAADAKEVAGEFAEGRLRYAAAGGGGGGAAGAAAAAAAAAGGSHGSLGRRDSSSSSDSDSSSMSSLAEDASKGNSRCGSSNRASLEEEDVFFVSGSSRNTEEATVGSSSNAECAVDPAATGAADCSTIGAIAAAAAEMWQGDGSNLYDTSSEPGLPQVPGVTPPAAAVGDTRQNANPPNPPHVQGVGSYYYNSPLLRRQVVLQVSCSNPALTV